MISKNLKFLLLSLVATSATLSATPLKEVWDVLRFLEKSQHQLPKNDATALLLNVAGKLKKTDIKNQESALQLREHIQALMAENPEKVINGIFDVNYALYNRIHALDEAASQQLPSKGSKAEQQLELARKIYDLAKLDTFTQRGFRGVVELMSIVDARKDTKAGIAGSNGKLSYAVLRCGILAYTTFYNLVLDENTPQELLNELYETAFFKEIFEQ